MYKIHLLDIDKTKEWLDVLHPYLRWGLLIIYGLMFLHINKIFIKDPILRAWMMKSFEEDGKTSGKSITAFVFVKLIAFATLTAIIYSNQHILPEFFLISLLSFVASLYGIKVASKYFTPSDSSSTSSTTTSIQSTKIEEIKKEPKEEVKEENKEKLNPEDVG